MSMQERGFTQIFGEIPEPSEFVSNRTIRTTLQGAAILLQQNPSEEAIVDAIGYFATKPKEYVERASDALSWDEELRNADIDNPLLLVRDIVAAVYHAYHAHDYSTDGLPDDFNPQVEATNIVDRIWLQGEEKKWEVLGKQLREEEDRSKKVELALQIKQNSMDYILQNSVQFRGGSDVRKVIPTWENISGSAHAEIQLRNVKGSMESFDKARADARRVLDRADLEIILNQLPRVDKEMFDGLRVVFGAKAANLIMMQSISEQMNKLIVGDEASYRKIPSQEEFKIPDFIPVPVDLYRKWSAGESIDDDLQPYFDWTRQQVISGGGYFEDELDSYIVRSSAVHSEDGDKLSGAGIYDSVVVEYEDAGSYEAFKSAVAAVFESTHSQKAFSYREENGVPEEEMALVIQRRVPEKYAWGAFDRAHKVTVNSSTPGINGLTEIIEDDKRFFVRKDVVDEHLAHSVPNNAAHFKPDSSDDRNTLYEQELVRYSITASLLERIWDGPVQLECVGDYLVQVRRVTQRYDGETVEFPDEQELLKGSGIGIGDKRLKVLQSRVDNSRREGIVQFSRNWEWSFRGDPAFLPRVGAVIVQETTQDGNGHLQTLAVEKGLLCLYPDDGAEASRIPELKEGAEVRIVSNGIEARLYQVGDENPIIEESFYYDPDEDYN